MNTLDFLNEIIQGLVIFILIANAINTKSLSSFQLIITLIGVLYSLYTRIISKFLKDVGE